MKPRVTLALSYASSYGTTFEDFVRKAAAAGFDAVQLIPDQAPNLYSQFTKSRSDGLRRLMADLGVAPSLHNVFYDINLLSIVPDVRELAFGITDQVIRLALRLGASRVTAHPGYMFGGWRRDAKQATHFWEEARKTLSRLGELASERSIAILLENGSYYLCTAHGEGRVPLHVGITPEEVRDLLSLGGGNLGFCLDINKALRSGHPIEEFVAAADGRISQVQVSTVGRYREVVGQVLATLYRRGQDIEVVLEGSSSEVVEGKEILESLRSGLVSRGQS